ncbi:MAG: hypothetical protein GY932_07455 [Arcobacter sp.]|nr:hypothetical protein [Arcobacter sp.]
MKYKLRTVSFIIFISVLLNGCGSNFYHYTFKPTPIKNDISKFNVDEVDVALHNLGNKKIEVLNKYPNEDGLSTIFKNSFIEHLKKNKRYCTKGENCFTIDVDVNYQRIFSIASNSVAAPIYSYFITIKNDKNEDLVKFNRIELAIDSISRDFKAFEALGRDSVNLETEKNDINFITKLITKDEILRVGE